MQIDSLLLALEVEFQRNNMHFSRKTKILICKFLVLLHRWNMVHNLTGHKDESLFIREHVIDALTALRPLKKKLKNILKKKSPSQTLALAMGYLD